jgi:flagellar biosynthesis protein FlhF
MRVKKYLVDSMPEALQKIKQELGKNAVILNTKEVRIGGFMGMFGRRRIEVIAAIDDPLAFQTNVTAPINQSHTAVPVAAAQEMSNPNRLSETAKELTSKAAVIPTPQQAIYRSSSVAVLDADPDHREEMLQEITSMKTMIQKLFMQKSQFDSLPDVIQKVAQLLLEQEVSEDIVCKMISDLTELHGDLTSLSEEQAIEFTKQYLIGCLQNSSVTEEPDSKQIIQFVGPTGVGKTTTIAKLAADYMLKKKRKVGFITSDTYRIAAVDQLRTYANILNIPLEVVSSAGEMKKALENLQSCDIILMDTAGRNYRNDLHVSELRSLLGKDSKSETILVLSLTSKYSDMIAITEQFKKIKLDKVLFTKADETHSYGAIVNLAQRYSLELSFLTYGQNVPDDITTADSGQVADLILGAKRYA